MKRLPSRIASVKEKAKEEFLKILRHRFFALFLTLFGIVLPLAIFLLTQNYRPLIYPPLLVDQTSPKKFVEQKLKESSKSALKAEVIEHGSRFKHQVALTFDADMTPGMLILFRRGVIKSLYNQAVKKTLDQEKVKATVFLTGLWVQTFPKEAKELASDPLLEIGNHSFSHPAFTPNCFHLPVIDNAQDKNEVQTAQWAIISSTGVTPKYFRFPGGCYDRIDLETVSKLGLAIIQWDVAAGDGFNNNTNDIVQRVLARVKNGSVVAMHIHGGTFAPKTNEALQKIIPELKKQGYQFVTITELLK